jgi:DNA-binding NtrC family response regulator
VERAYLLAALRRTGWNKAKASRLLGLNYKTLREKVRDLGLERERFEG